MKKYFYLVWFSYTDDNGDSSSFNLGVFSHHKNAVKKVDMSVNLEGFRDYPRQNFEITKFAVDFDADNYDKSAVTLYCVWHEYDIDEDESIYTVFDYVSSFEKAQQLVEHLKKHSKIGLQYPNNFEITEEKVDSYNDWSEGFTKLN